MPTDSHELRRHVPRETRTLSSISVFTMSAKRPERWNGSPQSWGGPIWKSVVRIRARSATFVSTACDIAFANAWNNSTEYSCGGTQSWGSALQHLGDLPRGRA